MTEKICGIYCIENIKTCKVYVGQSINIHKRITNHISDLSNKVHVNVHLQRAWNLYGQESFVFSIITTCTLEDLDNLECYYIEKFQSMNILYGYNLTGGGNRNKITSDETRHRMSVSRIGRKTPEETKQKFSAKMKGRNITQEHKDRISASNTGKTRTTAQRQSVSDAQKGIPKHRKLGSSSGYRGVIQSGEGVWEARIRGRYLGRYKTPEDAARAFDAQAKIEYGKFAILNFVD
jgi:group I intron endonuclease